MSSDGPRRVRVLDEAPPTATLADVDITVELDHRPRRASDFPSEDRALEILAHALAKNPRNTGDQPRERPQPVKR